MICLYTGKHIFTKSQSIKHSGSSIYNESSWGIFKVELKQELQEAIG